MPTNKDTLDSIRAYRNTRITENGHVIACTLYETEIVRVERGPQQMIVTLRVSGTDPKTGRWAKHDTGTTRRRMNEVMNALLIPIQVFRDEHVTYVATPEHQAEPLVDGMRIKLSDTPDGLVASIH